jgi:hypothetical protein
MDKKRYNKKAWLRILEAVIAITLIVGAIIYIMSTNAPKKDISSSVYEKEKYILELISNNNTLRGDIISSKYQNVNSTIRSLIPPTWDFDTNICTLDNMCNKLSIPIEKDVYASEIVISSNETKYDPKKLRLFVWMK